MGNFGKIVKKANHAHTNYLLGSLLTELDGWNLSYTSNSKDATNEVIENFKAELRFLSTFLVYVQNSDVAAHIKSLVHDVADGFKESKADFRASSKKNIEGVRDHLDSAIFKLQKMLMLWRPQIKAAYDYAESRYSFDSHSPLSNYDLWMSFCDSLEQNLLDLLRRKDKLTAAVIPKLEAVNEMLESLKFFLQGIQPLGLKRSKFRYLLTHFGAVLVRTAHLSYLCWVDTDSLEEKSMVIMLSDLITKFTPKTAQVVEGCLDALMAFKPKTATRNGINFFMFLNASVFIRRSMKKWIEASMLLKRLISFRIGVEFFCRFLCPEKYQVETLNKGLGQLVQFVYFLNKEDAVRLILIDTVAAFGELGSYLCNGHETTGDRSKEIDPALNKLLQKIMLLVVEAFHEYFNRMYSKSVSMELFLFDFLERGLDFFRDFLGDNVVNSDPIWIYIEDAILNVRPIYYRAQNYRTLDAKSRLIIIEQHSMLRILRMEILLEEFLYRYPSLLPNVENQIETLHEELILVRTFLMVEKGENEKLILAHLKQVVSGFHSLHWNEITEDALSEFSLLLPDLVEKINLATAEIKKIYALVRSSLPSYFHKTDDFGFMDFLLVDLKELQNSKDVQFTKQIQAVRNDMVFLLSFLEDMVDKHEEHSDVKSLVSCILGLAYQVEYFIDAFVSKNSALWYHGVWLSDLEEDIKLTKVSASKISEQIDGSSYSNVLQPTRKVISPAKISQIDEDVVDLVHENELMIDRLKRGSSQLDVVSIVGMAGIGKTTLAKKVYNNPSVTYHFHIRAWCYVSQVYQKRKLLLDILGDIVELTDDILNLSDEDLYMELYRSLKGKRYLIVMDDVWSIDAWNDFKGSFPNDKCGSRILITSRLHDVAAKTKEDSVPYPLRLLSSDESWDLLQRKLFKSKDCPDELEDLGKQIARSCGGLPLALVAISGLLQKTQIKPDRWKQVLESLSSLIANDPESRCMDILRLSYNHLPNHLKLCFLYLGAFVQDKEIPVRKLVWLWIAEGFIRNAGPTGCVEDVAEEYLTDLIGRSLVITSKRRSNGGVKTCRVHDMLRSLCSLILEDDSFLEQVNPHDKAFASFPEDLDFGVDPNHDHQTSLATYRKRRLSIYSKRNHFVMSRPFGPHVHSLLYFATSDLHPKCPYNISFILGNFKRLRVLDLECINMGQSFPNGIEVLVRLRYLALSGDVDCIPDSISKFQSLQTLLLKGLKGIVLLPDTIWSMAKLRHVHVTSAATFSLQRLETEISSQLDNLVSLSCPSLSGSQDAENILRRLPKLRKLKCIFSESRDNDTSRNSNQFPVLDFLKDLESLKVVYSGRNLHPRKFDFPLALRRLTLSKFRLPWHCISEIGKLPNIEVLKLVSGAFEGKIWDMKDGEFLKLKFLKLDTLNIAQWNASGDSLPNLQHLVLRSCRQLEEVPSGFGDIPTLEVIEVQMCRFSVAESVKRLNQEQLDLGNEELKILISCSDWDF